MHAKSLQLCLILYYPMDCKWPGSSVHGISQARILEWVAIPCFRGSSWPRNQTHVCSISLTGRQRWYWWINNFPFKAANARDVGLVPGLGSSPGKGNGNALQCSCLGNPMDREPVGLQSMGMTGSYFKRWRHKALCKVSVMRCVLTNIYLGVCFRSLCTLHCCFKSCLLIIPFFELCSSMTISFVHLGSVMENLEIHTSFVLILSSLLEVEID